MFYGDAEAARGDPEGNIEGRRRQLQLESEKGLSFTLFALRAGSSVALAFIFGVSSPFGKLFNAGLIF